MLVGGAGDLAWAGTAQPILELYFRGKKGGGDGAGPAGNFKNKWRPAHSQGHVAGPTESWQLRPQPLQLHQMQRPRFHFRRWRSFEPLSWVPQLPWSHRRLDMADQTRLIQNGFSVTLIYLVSQISNGAAALPFPLSLLPSGVDAVLKRSLIGAEQSTMTGLSSGTAPHLLGAQYAALGDDAESST